MLIKAAVVCHLIGFFRDSFPLQKSHIYSLAGSVSQDPHGKVETIVSPKM